ncbi:MAG: alpha/beta fold hydrolase [Gammaproteobacteria bacterium]
MKKQKGSIKTGRFEMPYRRYGDSPNMLVCVSGALQTMAIWRTVVNRFSDDFTVVVFDMPGVGRSKILSGSAHVTVDEQLESLHALIDATHSGGELTLSGSSWGTAIAALYAARQPNAVQHLVLCSFGIKPNAALEQVVHRATALFEARDFAGGADLILEVFGKNIGNSYKRQIVAQFKQLTGDQAESFHEHCSNILKLGRLDDEVDLSEIKARTVIVNGADDPIVDMEDMALAQRLIPNCELRLIEGVGHFLHFEKPELLEEYAEFLLPDNPATSLLERSG